jgi:cyclohexanone monooxygenase
VDIDYYGTYNHDNVTLVDVRADPIAGITRHGISTADAEYELDVVVFATGFDAITGALLDIDIRGRGGRALKDKWWAGPRSYLGLATAGFPNMFHVTGPGSPSVLSNMVCSIEQHIDWIADCIGYLREHRLDAIEATPDAEDSWVAHVAEVAEATLFPQANSWYVGANIAGKPRVFMPYLGGVGNYRAHCDRVADNGYEGFSVGGEVVGARS